MWLWLNITPSVGCISFAHKASFPLVVKSTNWPRHQKIRKEGTLFSKILKAPKNMKKMILFVFSGAHNFLP